MTSKSRKNANFASGTTKAPPGVRPRKPKSLKGSTAASARLDRLYQSKAYTGGKNPPVKPYEKPTPDDGFGEIPDHFKDVRSIEEMFPDIRSVEEIFGDVRPIEDLFPKKDSTDDKTRRPVRRSSMRR